MTQYRDHITIDVELELYDHGITIAFPLRREACQTCRDMNIVLFVAW